MNFYLKMALKIYYLDKSREKNGTKVFLLRADRVKIFSCEQL